MAKAVSGIIEDPVKGEVEFPNEVVSTGLSGKAWLMIFVIIILTLLWILGAIVEFTKLGDHSSYSEESIEEMKLEDRKSKLGLFLYSFSPVNNIRKLFIVSKKGDQSLAVLNGVRVLSIGWIVVGHSFNFILLVPMVNMTNMRSISLRMLN